VIECEIHLTGGTQTLQKRRGSWILQPDGRAVEVQLDGQSVTITDPDTGRQMNTTMAAKPASHQRRRGRPRQAAPTGDRWAAINEFIDVTMRTLGEAEARVWLVLFRDVRDGLARAGMTDIANRAGLTRRGVTKAIASLKVRGLVEVVTRGSVNGTSNVYRVRSVANLGNGSSLGTTAGLGNHGSPP
jgi:hypothetical protein